VNAFAYLAWTSARNRAVTLVRRARNPRHVVALLVGVGYIWLFLFRPVSRGTSTSLWAGKPVEMLATLLLTLTLAGAWVFGSDTLALAFTPAEVSMLFPAPVSRRGLIGYKLYRAQIGVLINALIWVFVLRRGGTAIPSPLRALSLWVLFSTLNLHRLGAALVWSALRQHGRSGVKRNGIALIVFSLMGAALVAGLIANRAALTASNGMGGFFKALGNVLASFPAVIALFPMHILVGPAFATSAGAWLRAMPYAIALLAVHALWVIRSDAAFEDAAIEASAERARRRAAGRTRRGAARVPKASTAAPQLASTGHPAVAIVWKNMLCLRRTAQARLLIAPTAMAIGIGAAAAAGGNGWPEIITASALALAGMLFLFGGRLIRNDLRHDMLHLPFLKSSPLASADIVLAEVASGALPIAALAQVLIIVAFASAVGWREPPLSLATRVALLVASPFAMLALNSAVLTIQNGIAVLFPAWIRLGPAVSTGVEALGQNLLSTVANVIGVGVALIVPLLIGWTAVAVLGTPRAVTLALVIITASIVLAGETYLAIRYLGTALARAEPLQAE